MISRWMRAAGLLAMAPAAALAFETVDTLPWPSAGRFPAYEADPRRPWDVWAQAGTMWDSNVLRLTNNGHSDLITRVGLGGRADQLVYGRQRVLVEAAGEYYDYAHFDQLSHFAYGLRGEWLWELGNSLSGTLGYRRAQRLADVGEIQRSVKDLVTSDRLYALGAWRFAADWRLTGGLEGEHIDHNGRAISDAQSRTARAGLEYVTPLGNALGMEYRRTRGDAPVAEELGLGAFPDNEFDEEEVALTFSYGTPQLRARGRVGRTTRSYTELSGRDFDGTTYRGILEWIPSVKTTLVFEAYREPSAIVDATALHVVRQGAAFGPNWAPTAKLVFSARFVNERREFEGNAVDVAGVPLRDETIRVIRLGAGWEPQRFWQVSTALDRGNRESNTLGRNYDYTAATLNLKFVY